MVYLLANNESCSKHNLKTAVHPNEYDHKSVKKYNFNNEQCSSMEQKGTYARSTAWRARGSSSCFRRQHPAQ